MPVSLQLKICSLKKKKKKKKERFESHLYPAFLFTSTIYIHLLD